VAYLHETLSERVTAWSDVGYPHGDYPAIVEILGHAHEEGESGNLRYLRAAQFRALETYPIHRIETWTLAASELMPALATAYGPAGDISEHHLAELGGRSKPSVPTLRRPGRRSTWPSPWSIRTVSPAPGVMATAC
jgi:hypothetical protein